MIDTSIGFSLVREIDATPEDIWNAWTDPDEMAHWFHPRGMITPRESVAVDLRVGGEYRYDMVGEPGSMTTVGVYREIVPLEKLVFTWGNPTDADEDRPIVTITIESLGELSRMTFDLRGFAGMPGDGFIYDGWESALDELVEYLGQNEVLG